MGRVPFGRPRVTGPSGCGRFTFPAPRGQDRDLPRVGVPGIPGPAALACRVPLRRERPALLVALPLSPRPLPSSSRPLAISSLPRSSPILLSSRLAESRLLALDTPSLTLSPHVFLVPCPGGAPGASPLRVALPRSFESPLFLAPDRLAPWLALPPHQVLTQSWPSSRAGNSHPGT